MKSRKTTWLSLRYQNLSEFYFQLLTQSWGSMQQCWRVIVYPCENITARSRTHPHKVENEFKTGVESPSRNAQSEEVDSLCFRHDTGQNQAKSNSCKISYVDGFTLFSSQITSVFLNLAPFFQDVACCVQSAVLLLGKMTDDACKMMLVFFFKPRRSTIKPNHN